MKKLNLALVFCLSLFTLAGPSSSSAQASVSQRTAPAELAGLKERAQRVTIVRDDWGIPHVYGKTVAEAVAKAF
jgi:acyl-homoserine-lactone acylase